MSAIGGTGRGGAARPCRLCRARRIARPDPQRPEAMVPEPRPDWATELPELLPAIRACLDASGQPAVGVTKAWPIAEESRGRAHTGTGR